LNATKYVSNALSSFLALFRQLSYLVSHHGKTSSCLSGTGSLNGSI